MWEITEDGLYKKFEFDNFIDAFHFMEKVALLAERENHHPLWRNDYNVVEIYLTTKEEGNFITEKDYALSRLIDGI